MARRITAAGRARGAKAATKDARTLEIVGAVEPYRDAAFYDWEYRRRREDVDFYRMLASERGGPILDLGCGSGRLLAPLGRDGFKVLGVDMSPTMLARARARQKGTGGATLLTRGDLRALPVRGPFPLVVMAFHTIQHFVDDAELVALLRSVRALLGPKGWFAFDVFFPRADWLNRPSNRRFDRILFRHPKDGQGYEYSVTHRLDATRRALHMRFHYRRVSPTGEVAKRGAVMRLCHRQLSPTEVAALLDRAGLTILSRWGGFKGEPLDDPQDSEEHVYLVRAKR
jgi:SAM-dependent methyltransferase